MAVQYFTIWIYVNAFNLSVTARLLDCFQIFPIMNKFCCVHLCSHSRFSPLGLIPGSGAPRIPALSSKFRAFLGCAQRGLFVKICPCNFPEPWACLGSQCLCSWVETYSHPSQISRWVEPGGGCRQPVMLSGRVSVLEALTIRGSRQLESDPPTLRRAPAQHHFEMEGSGKAARKRHQLSLVVRNIGLIWQMRLGSGRSWGACELGYRSWILSYRQWSRGMTESGLC